MKQMEHRWGGRQRLTLDVLLDCRPLAYGRGRVRDASVSGVFVETTISAPPHARVAVVFTTTDHEAATAPSLARGPRLNPIGAVTRLYRIEAQVARVAADGLALAWGELNPPGYRELLELAQPAVPKTAHAVHAPAPSAAREVEAP
jgi:hypothetical protein